VSASDLIFDGGAGETFTRDIYGTTKGDVRLHVLWHDLVAEIPALRDSRLRVIDVGAGTGLIAARVAELGHEVTLCEPSRDMLEKARATMREAGLTERVHVVQATLQDLESEVLGEIELQHEPALLPILRDVAHS